MYQNKSSLWMDNVKNSKSFNRKTSAEIVSEARNLLANGGNGTRLVSTRRPITPREPRRLYGGRNAPAGRPPSSFSLRYLQFETRALPALEPIVQNNLKSIEVPQFKRSESENSLSILEKDKINNNNSSNKGKLPALLSVGKVTGSLDNLTECMPPRKSFRTSSSGGGAGDLSAECRATADSIVKNHPLQKRQAKSFDGRLPDHLPAEEHYCVQKTAKNDVIKKPVKNPAIIPPKNRLIRSNDILTQSSTETLLDILKAHAGVKECTEEIILHINAILLELYTRVKGAKGTWRGAVLGALYGLVECTSPRILLSVARVVLSLNVTGSNLTGACKLIFKIAKNEKNDHLFLDTDVPELLVEGLGRASPVDETEACIYGYGAVRFLSGGNLSSASAKQSNKQNSTNASTPYKQHSLAYRLIQHGIIQLMILHLQIINEIGATKTLEGPPLHALFQLSGALRTLAGVPLPKNDSEWARSILLTSAPSQIKFPQIQESQEMNKIQYELAGPHLVRAAEICMGEIEVQTNVVRTLSILSDNENCCEYLANSAARIGILIGPIEQIELKPEKSLTILNRLGYILGNIMAQWDSARIQFFYNDVSMDYLLNSLEYFSKQNINMKVSSNDSIVDVLIKLVRVIANISVNSDVGYGLSIRPPLGGILLNLLSLSKQGQTAEEKELLLATLGALHNLSYYQDTTSTETIAVSKHGGSMIERIKDLTLVLGSILKNGPDTAKAEVARVLGNMTRNSFSRETFCSDGGLKTLTKQLESEDIELVATSCGVLVNLLGDWERRAPFRELMGPHILRDILLRSAMEGDWLLAGIVCQAFWNYLIDTSNVISALGEDEADFIAGDLVEFLDDEKLFHGEPPDVLWEQFAAVATDLLERIQSCMTITNSPTILSSDDDSDELGEVEADNLWGGKFKEWLQQ